MFLSNYGYPTPSEENPHKYTIKMCIHLTSIHRYGYNGDQKDHMIFPCQTYEEKLVFADWVEKELFEYHFHDHVHIEFADITFPFDATLL